MSRKHNTRHPDRGRSLYGDRLTRRGLSRAPEMDSVERLRERQAARERRTGSPYPVKQDWQDEEEEVA